MSITEIDTLYLSLSVGVGLGSSVGGAAVVSGSVELSITEIQGINIYRIVTNYSGIRYILISKYGSGHLNCL